MKEELNLHFHKHLFSPVVIACQNQFASAAAYEIIALCTNPAQLYQASINNTKLNFLKRKLTAHS
jgi:hypothetical protein